MSLLIKNIILKGKKQDIYIEGKKIKKIGKNLNFKAKDYNPPTASSRSSLCSERASIIDGKGEKAVIPGLINCHTHAAMTLFRGYGDDLPLKDWLEKKIWPLEKKLNEEDIYWGTKLACLEMIKTGTTFFNDMYWYSEVVIEATKEIGIRAVVGPLIIDFDERGSLKNFERIYRNFKSEKSDLIKLAVTPHSIYTVSKENLIWVKNFAKKNNLILHIHLSETEKEIKDCLKKYHLRPVEYLEKIGFLGKNCVLVHSVWLNDKEIEILKKRKCSVVYNPCSNLKLAVGQIFPYKKFKENKVNVCLGTDGPASNNSLDMFLEMKTASLLQKHQEKNPTVLPAKEVIKIATQNGAKALKINTGKIKEGKLADLILIDLNQVSLKPGHNFISDIVYSASGNCVSDMICNGKAIMRERKIEREKEIIKKATKRAKELIER
ncbi:amidohydrolase [Patescibacteria group bacterium]|nr:amidohydrolase [Patescibacteria group bacterium]